MKLFTLFLIVTLFPLGLLAQQSDPDDFQDGILLEQVGSLNGQLIITPADATGQSAINYQQVMDMLRSRVSSATGEQNIQLIQEGDQNNAEINMTGQNNAMEVTQRGSGNTYEADLNGDENLIHVLQNGHLNKLYQVLSGSNMELQVIQEGNGHELLQIETAGNAPAYQVHQRGEGMNVIIEFGVAGIINAAP